jgi:hypothetical protein
MFSRIGFVVRNCEGVGGAPCDGASAISDKVRPCRSGHRFRDDICLGWNRERLEFGIDFL